MSKLIIFDCDGVLVDSEIIASRIEAQMLTKVGYPISVEESIKKFTGMNEQAFRALVLKESGIVYPEDLLISTEKAIIEALEKELKPLIFTILEDPIFKGLKKCVASNSAPERVFQSLKITNQDRFFNENCIFTASQVQHGKPAPDLFLFAAHKMGCNPKDCLVIEDSTVGIQAARSAQMKVIGFLGSSHAQFSWYRERVEKQEVPVVYDQTELLSAIKHFIGEK